MHATAYPRLRASLAPEFAELADEQLDALVAEIYGPGLSAEDVESFWRDVGRGFQSVARGVGQVAKQAAPVVGRALPAMAQGAMTGATVAGPWGALAGAVAGGAGGVLSQSRDPRLRGIGGAIGGVTQLASNLAPGGALRNLAGVGLGGGTAGLIGQLAGTAAGRLGGRVPLPAGAQRGAPVPGIGGTMPGANANALLGMLARPETLRALSSAAMGRFGRAQVPVGNQPVPVQSILGTLGRLAERAAAEAEAIGPQSHPPFFYDAEGELAIDPADAEARADALLELFAATPTPYVEWLATEMAPAVEHHEPEYTAEDAEYDEWLLTNEAAWYDEALVERGDV